MLRGLLKSNLIRNNPKLLNKVSLRSFASAQPQTTEQDIQTPNNGNEKY
jgi:hypothetical protein